MGKDKFVLIGKIKKGDFKRFMEIASVLREFDMHNPNVEILEAEILEDLKKEHIHKNNIKNKWGGNYILLYNNNYTPFAPQSPIIEKYLGNMGRFLRLTC